MQVGRSTIACLVFLGLIGLPVQGRSEEPVEAMPFSVAPGETQPEYLGPRRQSDVPVLDLGPQMQQVMDSDVWTWQVIPEGLMYRSYLAGEREPRLSAEWYHRQQGGYFWDATLGTRVGLFRYGTTNPYWPEGFQLDVEGGAFLRMTADDYRDMVATDFRGGVPITYRCGPLETKFGYFHISAHAGDEFILHHPDFVRINYVRDTLVAGAALRPIPDVRIYAEVAWAIWIDGGAEPWEFQFGVEYSPVEPTGASGAPFFAINAHLREENKFGGVLSVQTGWQWRNAFMRLLRFGVFYQTGESSQYEFYSRHEDNLGLGLWYDF